MAKDGTHIRIMHQHPPADGTKIHPANPPWPVWVTFCYNIGEVWHRVPGWAMAWTHTDVYCYFLNARETAGTLIWQPVSHVKRRDPRQPAETMRIPDPGTEGWV